MKIDKYGNEKIINFYITNGLEFDESKKYFGTNVRTFVLIEDEKIIGAVSISIYKCKSFIEALAVDKKYRNKGYGKLLIQKAIDELVRPIYAISRENEFYLKNNFVFSNEDLIGKDCKRCYKYNVTCFPKVVEYK